jgi:outer membrane protein assembly factor BamB
LAILIGIGSQAFEIIGVSGDLVPIIRLKSSGSSKREQGSGFSSCRCRFLASSREKLPSISWIKSRRSSSWDFNIAGTNANNPQGTVASADRAGMVRICRRRPFAYTQEQSGDEEAVTCYQLSSGSLLWKYAYPADYSSVIAGNGPRATPTISGDYLITMGSTGVLNCLNRSNGELVWSHDVIEAQEPRSLNGVLVLHLFIVNSEVIVPSGEGE